MRTPWRDAAMEAENKLRVHLGLEDTVGIIYVNRGAAAIRMALQQLRQISDVLCYEWPSFEAVKSIAQTLNYDPLPHHDLTTVYPVRSLVYSPVALGGEPVNKKYFERFHRLVYDCAQTCYKNMFKGVFFTNHQYAILSFEQSKPMGSSAGGGALLCHRGHEEYIRNRFVPGTYYFNPRTGQATETARMADYDKWARARTYARKQSFENRVKALIPRYCVLNNYRDPEAENFYTHIYVARNKAEAGPPRGGGNSWQPYANGDVWRQSICIS